MYDGSVDKVHYTKRFYQNYNYTNDTLTKKMERKFYFSNELFVFSGFSILQLHETKEWHSRRVMIA